MAQSRPSATTRRENADPLAILTLSLLATLPYLNSLANSFVYDDGPQILRNPYVHSFRYLGRIFGSTVWTFEGAQGTTDYYRPLMTFAYLITYKIFGPLPFGFHLLNIALHLAVVLLLFAVTERMFEDRLLSLSTAGLFALHPIHTESVAWIAAITDLQLSAFFLLTFWLYLRLSNSRSEAGSGWPSYLGILVAYILTLLSKEQALVLPALLIVYEHFYRPGSAAAPFRTKFRRYLPVCVIAAGYIAFRRFALGGFAPAIWRPAMPWKTVILSALALTGGYFRKLIWPTHLTAFYVFHESSSTRDSRVIGGVVGLVLCLALFIWLWRHARPVSFAFFWTGATLAPVLNPRWMPTQVFAERYLYLPSVGFCWLLAWAATSLSRRADADPQSATSVLLRQAVPLTLIAVACLYVVVTVRRNPDWRSDEVLYRRTLEAQPDAQIIHTNLGVVYSDRGDWADAEREWNLALGPAPANAATLNDLGLLRKNQGRYAEAADLFARALRLRPKFAGPYKNLGEMYEQTGQTADADQNFRQAVSLAPLNTQARNSYGHFLLKQGRMAQAREQFALSAAADANSEAYDNLGDLDLAAAEPARARADYEAALALDHYDHHADFGVAAIDDQQGRVAAAVREYRAGLETDPRNPVALAAVERLAGRPPQ